MFVRSHAHLIAAEDFFATKVWTVGGLVRHFTLSRNVTDCDTGVLRDKRSPDHRSRHAVLSGIQVAPGER
jgi:hypothetical protein